MKYLKVNPNPCGSYVGDCVIRAISLALDQSWSKTYLELAVMGLMLCDMPSSNRVWGEYLRSKGYHRHIIPDMCPECYTLKDFCGEFFNGTYIVGTGTHAVCVKDGVLMDSWNSEDEAPLYYWSKED